MTTSGIMLSALIEKVYLLLPYASNTDCENTFDLIANFARRAGQEKDRRLARPPMDQISLQSLLADNFNGDSASLQNKKR
jgi:hypothetical protein